MIKLKDLGIENVDSIATVRGFIIRKGDAGETWDDTNFLKLPVPCSHYASNGWTIDIVCNATTLLIQLGPAAYDFMVKFEVILEYTKK